MRSINKSLKKIGLLFNTIKYLKAQQVLFRLYYRFRHFSLPSVQSSHSRGWGVWDAPAYMKSSTNDGVTFNFLGETFELSSDWNDASYSKLWLYNLHYLDNLNCKQSHDQYSLNVKLVNDWVGKNPVMTGNGWEPYVISLRVVNLIKWFAHNQSNNQEWFNILEEQGLALEKQIEYHILGNHLFANTKALIFLGSYLGGANASRWLSKGLNILDEQLDEQFLADGGHFELSPMYHSILLWDVCDLINLSNTFTLPSLLIRRDKLKNILEQGLTWLSAMTHSDGSLSFFNDSALGIGPTYDDLCTYAEQLGLQIPANTKIESDLVINELKPSGYISVKNQKDKFSLIVDVGKVGPDYQPGHAHADTLSFELCLFGERVFVNSGTSMYGVSEERHRQRGTEAHNTVLVDGENSSEVWGGFRVARRANVSDLEVISEKNAVSIAASHDGYRRLKGSVTHSRVFEVTNNILIVKDVLSGKFTSATASLHLHPDVEVNCDNSNSVILKLTNGVFINCEFHGAESVELEPSTWHPEFGLSIPNKKIAVAFGDSNITSEFNWSEH